MSSIDRLPDELVKRIICFAVTRLRLYLPSHLDVYCLVCKRWSRIAQPMLFKRVMLCSLEQLEQFHRSLMNSNKLRKFVRDITLAMRVEERSDSILRHPDWLVADCLQQASRLESFCVNSEANLCLTDLLLQRICLSKVKSFWIFSDSCFPEKFDCRALLDLPTTVERVGLSFTSATSLSLLPEICQQLQGGQRTNTSHHAKSCGSSMNARRQGGHKEGLRMLHLEIDAPSLSLKNVFKEVGTSLAPTLTAFSLSATAPQESVLIDLLGATPLIQVLDLGCIKLSPVLFDELPSLKQLRSLTFELYLGDKDEDGFCRSWGKFMSHSSHLETVDYTLLDGTFLATSRVIEVLMESTTMNGPISTLRNLRLDTSNPPSSESIKHLCRSAPLLEHIGLPVPESGLWQVAFAMKSLKHLVSAHLVSEPYKLHYATRYLGGDAIDLRPLFKEIVLYRASFRSSE